MRSVVWLVASGMASVGAAAFAMGDAQQDQTFDRVTMRAAEKADETSAEAVRLEVDAAGATRAVQAKLLPQGVRSLLRVPRPLEHGDFVWNETGAPQSGKVTVYVDLRRQIVSVFRDGHEIGTAVVVYGGLGKDSPTGTFKILRKYRDYHSRTYDAPMPYSQFITNDGVALHGSPMAADRATRGCIGLPIEFARRLFETTARGGTVQIARSQTVA